jgi:GDP-4-dehydro-6-deoxy-D-mannose reductase
MVYHCAGAAHVGHSWQHADATLRVNVLGTHHLLDAIRLARLQPKLLIPSSAMVYAIADAPISEQAPLRPRSPYALSKLAQEMVSRHGLEPGMPPASIARSFNHLGPRQDATFAGSSFARQIASIEAGLTAPVLKVGNLEAERDFTDVRDTVLAYRAMVEQGQPGSTYNVCSGRAIAVGELLDRMLARSTVAIRIERDPARQRPHDQPRLVGDHARIRRELGWEPRIPLDQTLEDLLTYWRTRVRVSV